MAFWPTSLSPNPGCVLAIALASSTIGPLIIIAAVLSPYWAILPIGAYTYMILWVLNIDPYPAFNVASFVFSLIFQIYYNQGTRVGLLCSLGALLLLFVLCCYIPLLLSFCRGTIRYQDLYPSHSYLIMKAVMMMMVSMYWATEDGNVNALFPFNYFSSFVGLVLMEEGIVLLRKFGVLELKRNVTELMLKLRDNLLQAEPVA